MDKQKDDASEALLNNYGLNDSKEETEVEKQASCCGFPWSTRKKLWVFFGLFVLCYFVMLAIVFRHQVAFGIQQARAFISPGGGLQTFLSQPGAKYWAPFVYGAIYVACTVLFIPASALTILAGVIFQSYWVALITVSIAATTGATCAMLIGRYVARDWVLKKTQSFKSFVAVEKAVSQTSWLVLLLRLSPAIPFNILNYALGLTNVPTIHYIVFSWSGMIPGTALFVYIGWVAKSAISGSNDGTELFQKILSWVVAPIATLLVIIIITWVARKKLNQMVAEMEEQDRAHAREDSLIQHQGNDEGGFDQGREENTMREGFSRI